MKSILRSNLMASIAFAANFDTGLSLADMAEMETDEIKALKSRLFPAGIVAVRITQAQLGENPPKEGIDEKTGMPYPKLFYTEFKYEVLEAEFSDKSIDAETYVGRILTHRVTFWPSSFNDEIGLLKGRYAAVGLDNRGRLGGMEGGEPGWIDNALEQVIQIKVRHGKEQADGNRNVFYDWVKNLQAQDESEVEAA